MARECLSRLQRHILAWLVAEDQRLWGTMIIGVNRTKVRKVSHDFSIISYINTLGDWQLLGFVAVPSTFGDHIFFATHCQI